MSRLEIPACAGMTLKSVGDSGLRRNDDKGVGMTGKLEILTFVRMTGFGVILNLIQDLFRVGVKCAFWTGISGFFWCYNQ